MMVLFWISTQGVAASLTIYLLTVGIVAGLTRVQ